MSMECALCSKRINEAFFVSVTPIMGKDGDKEKVRQMCAWSVDLMLCEECMGHIFHEMGRQPGFNPMNGMVSMNIGPDEGGTENDYISRWEAQDAMTGENLIRNLDQVENGDAKRYARAAIRVLEQLEPADVRPVARGEWITRIDVAPYRPDGEITSWTYKCSICGTLSRLKYNYCPNCGADMTGGEANAR